MLWAFHYTIETIKTNLTIIYPLLRILSTNPLLVTGEKDFKILETEETCQHICNGDGTDFEHE